MVAEPRTDSEAWRCILTGLGYFLSTHFKVTLLILVAMLCGLVFGAMFFASKGYDIQEILPTSKAVVVPEAFSYYHDALVLAKYADGGGEPIRFGGRDYGYMEDPGFEVAKILDQPAVLVWEKRTDRVFKVWINELEPRELKKYAK